MPRFKKIIDKTLKVSNLNQQEKADLAKELISHFFEAERNLLLQGKSEQEVVNNFGDPIVIGYGLRKAHRKYEIIPVLGDLIYYPPFRYGVFLALANILFFLIFFFFFSIVSNIFWNWQEKYNLGNTITQILDSFIFFFSPIFLAIISSWYIYKKIKSIVSFLLLLVISLLPYLSIMALIYFPQKISYGYSNFLDVELFLLLIFLVIFYIAIILSFLIIKIFFKLKNKLFKNEKNR